MFQDQLGAFGFTGIAMILTQVEDRFNPPRFKYEAQRG